VSPFDVTVPDVSGVPGGPDSPVDDRSGDPAAPSRPTFTDDFRRFFVRGLATLMPTLVTLWLLVWLWNFLWNSIGQHVIFGIRWGWLRLVNAGVLEPTSAGDIRHRLSDDDLSVRLLGVGLSILLVYLVGVLVGNLIGRTFYRIGEQAVIRIPLIRAIYPAVKQVTDFLLAERKQSHFAGSRVVAVQARTQGVWSIGFVTNSGYGPLNRATGGDMVTVFVPSTPTAFSGYVVVAHREATVDLPLTVEQAMRLLLSGGVIVPPPDGRFAASPSAVGPDRPAGEGAARAGRRPDRSPTTRRRERSGGANGRACGGATGLPPGPAAGASRPSRKSREGRCGPLRRLAVQSVRRVSGEAGKWVRRQVVLRRTVGSKWSGVGKESEVVITITGRHMDVTPAMKTFAEEKVNKLTKYYDRIQEIEVVFDAQKAGTSVEVIVNAEHNDMFIAREGDGDAYVLLDQCVTKLERQLTEHKKKHRNRKHPEQ
jgi:ribosomal subunit interface protein